MHPARKIWLALNNPRLLARKLNEFSTLIPKYDYTQNKSIFEKDWDNLILLDACNYNIAKQYDWGEDTLSVHRSRATSSQEFFRNEVSNRDLTDTVYISANAWIEDLYDDLELDLHKIIVFDINDPKILAQNMKEIAQNHENKRIVTHFIQPHFPVLSSDYEKINEEWYLDRPMNLWHRKMINNLKYDINREELIEAYKSNLETVLPIIKSSTNNIQGKTVVSADHGQLFGERVRPIPIKMWGHPLGAYADNLLNVPWIVYEDDNRKPISHGENRGIYKKDERNVKEKLKDLGYI